MNIRTHARMAVALLAILGADSQAAQARSIRPQTAACPPEHAAMGHCKPQPAPSAAPKAANPACTPEHAAMGHCMLPKQASPAVPSGRQQPASCTPEHAAMGHCTLSKPAAPKPAPTKPKADPACPPEHAAMGHCTPKTVATPPMPADPACPPEHAAMGHCTPKAAMPAPREPRTPIPPLTDADRAAAFPVLSHASMAHGGAPISYVLLDRLETGDAGPGHRQAWEGSAWIGGDIDRLWLRSEGQRTRGRLESAGIEALYGHAVSPWWDLLLGARNDSGGGPSRQWAALGVQGLAPYKFELAATAYVGAQGRTAAKVEADYDVLLSNRLILQPRIETWWHGRDDRATRTGAGLGSAEAGLRLRYEITRQFAPYVGVVHERRFGRSAGYARADGEDPRDTHWVAGLRIWF